MTNLDPIRFRAATIADHADFVRLFAELRVDDPPLDPDRFAAVIVPNAFFAEDGSGAIIGYAFYELLQTDGYVRHVVVDPAARGRGAGRAMMDELGRRFRAAGCTRWRLNVKPDNGAARGLYGACGMREAYSARVVRIAWEARGALPDAASPARVLEGDELDAFEAALGIPRGLLASLAGRGFVPLGVRDAGGAPLGGSAHDPRFPGSFPFRARTPEAARALLDAAFDRRVRFDDAARPWRDAGTQVVLEDGGDITDRLIAAGGEEVLVTLHYVGDL